MGLYAIPWASETFPYIGRLEDNGESGRPDPAFPGFHVG
jgi:hypothetical protein